MRANRCWPTSTTAPSSWIGRTPVATFLGRITVYSVSAPLGATA